VILPELEIGLSPRPLSPDTRILCLGSCFVEHLHEHLAKNGWPSFHRRQTCNHFNPASLAHMMRWVETGVIQRDEMDIRPSSYFDGEPGVFTSAHFRSLYAGSVQGVYDLARRYLDEFRKAVAEADLVAWTLGTADVLRAVNSGTPLCSGNGIDREAYRLATLDTAEVIASVDEVRRLCRSLRGGAPQHWVLSVSPQRYFWDALVQRPRDPSHVDFVRNSRSKSRLRCAVDALCTDDADTQYFPSYELVLDQLRMIEPMFDGVGVTHVSATAPGFVIAAFEKHWLAPSAHHYLEVRRKIERLIELHGYYEGVGEVLKGRVEAIARDIAELPEHDSGRDRLLRLISRARNEMADADESPTAAPGVNADRLAGY
jgi:hypothetical protein